MIRAAAERHYERTPDNGIHDLDTGGVYYERPHDPKDDRSCSELLRLAAVHSQIVETGRDPDRTNARAAIKLLRRVCGCFGYRLTRWVDAGLILSRIRKPSFKPGAP